MTYLRDLFWKPKIWSLAIACSTLIACETPPKEAQLDQWHQEAVAENQRLSDLYQVTDEQLQWTLAISGQTQDQKTYNFNWSELDQLATTHVPTKEPHTGKPPNIFDFRGIRVSQLLDLAKIDPQVTEVTFVADDGYRVAVQVADIKKYDIILAVERDKKPIPRSEGGPLYLVYPFTQFPKLNDIYPSAYWSYYVTHLIFGNETLKLKIKDKILDQTAFEQLPQNLIETPVGHRMFWTNAKVKLKGVRLQDLLTAQGITLTPDSKITILGKANVDRNPQKPIQLTGQQIEACTVLLATHWGEKLQPISQKMGGPITLAFDQTCETKWQTPPPWTTFIEEITVEP